MIYYFKDKSHPTRVNNSPIDTKSDYKEEGGALVNWRITRYSKGWWQQVLSSR